MHIDKSNKKKRKSVIEEIDRSKIFEKVESKGTEFTLSEEFKLNFIFRLKFLTSRWVKYF